MKLKYFILLPVLMLVIISWKANKMNTPTDVIINLTGEQIFKEIIFLEKINYSVDTPKLNLDNQSKSKIIEEIICFINDIDSSYFDDLKQVVETKDPYLIKDKIIGIQSKLKKYNDYKGNDLAYASYNDKLIVVHNQSAIAVTNVFIVKSEDEKFNLVRINDLLMDNMVLAIIDKY
jgi:hypothetical protein